eukprot:7109279-Alexandrium_andersonii.AAC.1
MYDGPDSRSPLGSPGLATNSPLHVVPPGPVAQGSAGMRTWKPHVRRSSPLSRGGHSLRGASVNCSFTAGVRARKAQAGNSNAEINESRIMMAVRKQGRGP